MAVLKNRAGVVTATSGTGTITLGAAIAAGAAFNSASWQTFAAAGVANGDSVRYLILDSNGAWEYGLGTYTSAGTALIRSTGAMDGTVPGQKSSTGSLISLTGTAQVFITAIAEDLVSSSGSALAIGGRLTFVSATALKFAPFNGNQIKIAGGLYQIPDAGISGLANTGIFKEGVAGQSLSANTVYYVYAFLNSGVVTAEFSQTAHATCTTIVSSGNEGVEIKSNNPAYTLIGMCRTTAASQFADFSNNRSVLSWFNRRPIMGQAAFPNNVSTTSTIYVEIDTSIRVSFLTWSDAAVAIGFSGTTFNASGLATGFTQLYDAGPGVYFDGFASSTSAAAGYAAPQTLSGGIGGTTNTSEGFHTATVYGHTTSGTQTWYGAAAAPDRCNISVITWG